MSPEERQSLIDAKKCFECKEEGHMARDCPNRMKKEREADKGEPKTKKARPSAGLVPDVIGESPTDATELCRAWGRAWGKEIRRL